MAFPLVQARLIGTSGGSNVTSQGITLPISGMIDSDIILVTLAVDGSAVCSASVGTGWTKMGDATDGTSAVTGSVFWNRVNGVNSPTLVVNFSTTQQCSWISQRIRNAITVTGSFATGGSTNSNPPSVTMANSKDYLWIVACMHDAAIVASGSPTNYANLQTSSGTGSQGATTNTADRSLNAVTEDPGTFAVASEQWVAWTLALTPGFDRKKVSPYLYLGDTVKERLITPIGKVSWVSISAPATSLLARSVSDPLITDENIFGTTTHEYPGDNALFSDSVDASQPTSGDVVRSATDNLFTRDVQYGDIAHNVLDSLFALEARYGDLSVGLIDQHYLADFRFTQRELDLIDSLLTGDSVMAIALYLRASVDYLFTPDFRISTLESGKVEMMLMGDSLWRAHEFGQLEGLLHADVVLRAIVLTLSESTLVGDSASTSVQTGEGGPQEYTRSASDGLQFFDPDSVRDQAKRAPEFMFLGDTAVSNYLRDAFLRAALDSLILDEGGTDPGGEGFKIIEDQERDAVPLSENRLTDMLMSRLENIMLGEVATEITSKDAFLIAFIDRLLLDEGGSEPSGEGVKIIEDQENDYLLISEVIEIIIGGAKNVSLSDGLYLLDYTVADKLLRLYELILLGDSVSYTFFAELLRNAADQLLLGDRIGSDRTLSQIDGLLFDDSLLSKFLELRVQADQALLGDALASERAVPMAALDFVLLNEVTVEALRVLGDAIQRLVSDGLYANDTRLSEMLSRTMEGLLLDSMRSSDFSKSPALELLLLGDVANRQPARGLSASDGILLYEVMLTLRESLWSEGLLFSENIERLFIGLVISHLTYARIGVDANPMGVDYQVIDPLGRKAETDGNLLGISTSNTRWREYA